MLRKIILKKFKDTHNFSLYNSYRKINISSCLMFHEALPSLKKQIYDIKEKLGYHKKDFLETKLKRYPNDGTWLKCRAIELRKVRAEQASYVAVKKINWHTKYIRRVTKPFFVLRKQNLAFDELCLEKCNLDRWMLEGQKISDNFRVLIIKDVLFLYIKDRGFVESAEFFSCTKIIGKNKHENY